MDQEKNLDSVPRSNTMVVLFGCQVILSYCIFSSLQSLSPSSVLDCRRGISHSKSENQCGLTGPPGKQALDLSIFHLPTPLYRTRTVQVCC